MSLIQREKRVGLHLPVEVRGEDAAGSRFTEVTRSVNVSGGGILFESHRKIPIGRGCGCRSSCRVAAPPLRQIARSTTPAPSSAASSEPTPTRRAGSAARFLGEATSAEE